MRGEPDMKNLLMAAIALASVHAAAQTASSPSHEIDSAAEPQAILLAAPQQSASPGKSTRDAEETWAQAIQTASNLQESGDYREAKRILTELVRVAGTVWQGDARLAIVLNNLATLYQDERDYTMAERFYLRAALTWESAPGSHAARYAICLNNLAGMYLEAGQLAKAQRLLVRMAEPQAASLGREHPQVARMLENVGAAFYEQGNYSEAEAAYREALRITERSPETNLAVTASLLNNLGTVCVKTGRTAEGKRYFERTLDIVDQRSFPDVSALVKILLNVSTLAVADHRWADAERLLIKAASIAEARLDAQHPLLAVIWHGYAVLLRETNRQRQAKQAESRSRAILAFRSQQDPARHVVDFRELAAGAAGR